MAVLKSQRGESVVQFLDTARQLVMHTRRCCLKMPKRYTFFGAQMISALADEVYNEARKGNSIFPSNAHEAQMRRDHFTAANNALQALAGQLEIMAEILRQNPDCEKWLYKALEKWGELISSEAKMLSAIKKADKKKYQGLQ